MANRLGYETLQLPSFSDSNQANAQALSLALKGAQFEETQRVQEQQNILGQQLGEQFLTGEPKETDLVRTLMQGSGDFKSNLGIAQSLMSMFGKNNDAGKVSDETKEVAKLKKHNDNLAFKQQKEDRARFAKSPELAQAFTQPFVDRVSGDLTPFMADADKDRTKNALISAFLETGGDPEKIDLVRKNAENAIYDEQDFYQGTEFDVNKFSKNARTDIANAIELARKRKPK